MDAAVNERAVIGHNQPPLSERLVSDYEELTERIAAELTVCRDVPTTIESDEQNGQIAVRVKALRELLRETEDSRKSEIEPHLEAQRTTNGFFRALSDRLQKAKDILEARGKRYLDAKAAEERRRREEAARIAREQAEERERQARAAEEAGKEVQADILLDQAVEAEQRSVLAEEAAAASNADMARTRTVDGVATLATKWTFTITDVSQVPLEQLRPFISTAEVEKAVRGFVRAGGRQLAGVRIYEDTRASYR